MLRMLKAAGLAAAMLLTPGVASATTVLVPTTGGPFDILADDYVFNKTFSLNTAANVYSFTFVNLSPSARAFTLYGGTVLQRTAAFFGGVDITFGGTTYSFAQGLSFGGFADQLTVGAGQTASLIIDFGRVFDHNGGGGTTTISFGLQASPIPVPATGLLLLTAMGGLVVIGRRKSA